MGDLKSDRPNIDCPIEGRLAVSITGSTVSPKFVCTPTNAADLESSAKSLAHFAAVFASLPLSQNLATILAPSAPPSC